MILLWAHYLIRITSFLKVTRVTKAFCRLWGSGRSLTLTQAPECSQVNPSLSLSFYLFYQGSSVPSQLYAFPVFSMFSASMMLIRQFTECSVLNSLSFGTFLWYGRDRSVFTVPGCKDTHNTCKIRKQISAYTWWKHFCIIYCEEVIYYMMVFYRKRQRFYKLAPL